jgi:hypothetical protein
MLEIMTLKRSPLVMIRSTQKAPKAASNFPYADKIKYIRIVFTASTPTSWCLLLECVSKSDISIMLLFRNSSTPAKALAGKNNMGVRFYVILH